MADLSLTPVATQIKPVQGVSLGDMINMARGAQAYRQAEQANPLELQRLQAEANVAQQTEAPRIRGAEATAQTAETGAQSSAMDFANKQVLGIANRLTGLINDPLMIATEQNPNAVDPTKLAARLEAYGNQQAKELGISPEKAKELIAPYVAEATSNPAGIRQFLKNKLLSTLDQGSRLTAMQPTGQAIGTGASGYTVQTGQFGPYAPGQIIPGTAYEAQIPPTQQVVTPTGETRLIGPLSQRGGAPLTTGLGPAQTALLTSGGQTIGTDLATTQAQAKDAPARIAIFQNIKKFAPEAFTGVGGQRKELAAGILNAIGIPAYEQEKVNTEELAKNSALLALAGGNTDAARALAEVATPNKKLNEKAILGIADQMIGIERMNMARAAYLTPVQDDATKYGQRKLQFDQLADPRLFQEMSPQDVAKLKASMSQAEQAEMTRKIRLARQLGIIQ